MSEEVSSYYMNNNSNDSSTNITNNSTIPTIYALGPPLATISSTCIVIGTVFSIISLYRYLRKPKIRTYFTYLFHFMLIYCLISSFLNVPLFLMGYYLTLFDHSPRLCQYYSINALAINVGMVTCLAYASIERNYLIFRKNGLLSWRRQILPIVCLIFYSYFVSTLFIVIPQCPYIPCAACHTRELKMMILWLVISFIIPELIMFTSTILLIIRLSRQRINSHRQKDSGVFYRIVIQMALYVIWSCLYYCPPTFYDFSLIINANLYSPPTRSAMTIVNIVSVQSYPILTFILMTNYHRKLKRKKPTLNESALKLNAIPTVTEPAVG